ncbi:MAG: hypothetical protein MUO26_09260 [Methanotrichaceae archaeon]|nr:hypothetical protein [Methanotrichaceae archaeon]
MADSDEDGTLNTGSPSIMDGRLIIYNKADADETDEYDGHGGGIFYTEGYEPML